MMELDQREDKTVKESIGILDVETLKMQTEAGSLNLPMGTGLSCVAQLFSMTQSRRTL